MISNYLQIVVELGLIYVNFVVLVNFRRETLANCLYCFKVTAEFACFTVLA